MSVEGADWGLDRPSYLRLDDFDAEHTRFASKYSLYLYREQGVDDERRVGSSLGLSMQSVKRVLR